MKDYYAKYFRGIENWRNNTGEFWLAYKQLRSAERALNDAKSAARQAHREYRELPFYKKWSAKEPE